MQNTINVLICGLIFVSIVAILFIRGYLKAIRVLKEERQGALLYEIQNHTEPERLKQLYDQYISNLDDPDFDSLILRAKESMARNLKGKNREEHGKIFKVYINFIYGIKDPFVNKSLNRALFQ